MLYCYTSLYHYDSCQAFSDSLCNSHKVMYLEIDPVRAHVLRTVKDTHDVLLGFEMRDLDGYIGRGHANSLKSTECQI